MAAGAHRAARAPRVVFTADASDPQLLTLSMPEDGRKITSYYRYAVKSELHAQAAVESACSSTPSCVVAADSACGAVFQGGFMAVGNVAFLRKKTRAMARIQPSSWSS